MTDADGDGSEESVFDALTRPLSGRGLALSAVAAAPTLLAPIGGGPSWSLLAGAALSVVYLAALTDVVAGRPGFLLPIPGGGRRTRSPVGFAGRAFALYLGAVLPFVLAIAATPGTPRPMPEELLAIMLTPTLYLPAAIGAVVASGHAATAFWPFAWMRVIGAIGPASYARLATVFALTVAAAWATDQAAGRALATIVSPEAAAATHALATFVRTTLSGLVWLAQACALGAMLARHRRELGLER